MKRSHPITITIFLLLVTATLIAFTAAPKKAASTLAGAWGYTSGNAKNVIIFADQVFSVATYDVSGKTFLGSYGGTWRVNGNKLIRKIEWHSKDSVQVGNEWTQDFNLRNKTFALPDTNENWERLDDGTPGSLAGVWVITGNYTNDKVSKRANPFYPRRTMKVLSGKYFHWIAYNVATKQFMNAGGGTYTTTGDAYTENIEFFTKTPASVGKTLVFQYSFVEGDWRHKGEKSTGGAMDECWTRRSSLEK